jgi:predicted PurR-regulated permease PerM
MRTRPTIATMLLAVLTAASLYLCYLLFRPYAGPILFALVVAIVFHPLHRFSHRIFRNRSGAALVSMLVAVILTAVPLSYLAVAVSHEVSDLYKAMAARSAGDGGLAAYAVQWLQRAALWLSQHFPVPAVDVRGILMRRMEEMSASLLGATAGLLGNLLSFTLNAVIACFVLFFLFRDGEMLLQRLSLTLPLGGERFEELKRRIGATVVANFYGGVAVSAAQGTLTAIAFWAVGIGSPVLWGLVTAVFSFVPLVGSAAVWVPASLVLLLTGHAAKGVILLAVGVGVIGLVDNFLRPWIVSETVRLHTLYVFFALLGGVQVFGVMGLFLGPVILSITAALISMLQEDLKAQAHTAGQL